MFLRMPCTDTCLDFVFGAYASYFPKSMAHVSNQRGCTTTEDVAYAQAKGQLTLPWSYKTNKVNQNLKSIHHQSSVVMPVQLAHALKQFNSGLALYVRQSRTVSHL